MGEREERTWLLNPLFGTKDYAPSTVPEEGLTLGRDPSNAIRIDAARFPGVSGHHARISLEGDSLVVEDLGSKNGTQVRGHSIERHVLKHGDVIDLGSGGPRFVVLRSSGLGDTVEIPRLDIAGHQARSLGPETVRLVREELGISGEKGVHQMLQERSRHIVRWSVVAAVLLVGGILGVYWVLSESGRKSAESLHADLDAQEEASQQQVRALQEQLATAQADLEAQRSAWQAQAARLDAASQAWDSDKAALEVERDRQEAELGRLAADERAAAGELDQLRTSLAETTRTLALYDPVNLEQARLEKVSRVERSVVLIEARQRFIELVSGRPLYAQPQPDGRVLINLEFRGDPLEIEATGSGFCFSEEGWILTNAHVVHKKTQRPPLDLGGEVKIVPEIELVVVFSGESERHPASLVSWEAEGQEDLALLKIEPYEDMPHLDGLDLAVGAPARGTEVYLLGFPLGKQVFHRDDAFVASTFKGIVSRVLDYYVQVDAAVHPGASGGPLIDGQGRVLGVVVGMQTADERATTSAIGYIIPIAEAGDVWPPEE